MAVRKIPVPFCDRCGLPWLPKMLLKDGTRNPIFDHPEKSKRCGKCKRPGWNAGGVDRRRKLKPETIPQMTAQDVAQTVDFPEPTIPNAVFEYADNLTEAGQVLARPAPRARRCKHGLFKCEKCSEDKAA